MTPQYMKMETTAGLAVRSLKAVALDDVLYTPDQGPFGKRKASYRSLTAKLKPWAIVQPRNAEEVSKAVKALLAVPGCKSAVRRGGHMAWLGANNIQDGVTIGLVLMAKPKYSPIMELARLLPGGTWTDVHYEVERRR
ncbi:hypothetical protein ColLi_11949 [Colletotrichum liriopes]|uniref:Uncharacterized protein n=1 Tax=Colletotrichum liriopes TaxID=708192 RepID=A0AA37LZ00_9PEZI|nr:hypothetical protein ColLi_11949 [Colletotrichum liriopes]